MILLAHISNLKLHEYDIMMSYDAIMAKYMRHKNLTRGNKNAAKICLAR